MLKLPLPLKVYRWMRRITFKCVSFWCENVDCLCEYGCCRLPDQVASPVLLVPFQLFAANSYCVDSRVTWRVEMCGRGANG